MWFAAARPAIGAVLGRMFASPKSAQGLMSLAGRVLPDAGFALYNAIAAPEGTSFSDRALMGLEAFAANSLISGGGELGGGLIGAEVARRRGMGLNSQRAKRAIETGLQWGGNIGAIAGNFVPLPFTNRMYEQAYRRQQDQELAMNNVENADIYADLGGLGMMAAQQSLFDPRLLA